MSNPPPNASSLVWQPITTMPRDGAAVLVWGDGMHRAEIAWHDPKGRTMATYSHWMPLPGPPQPTPVGTDIAAAINLSVHSGDMTTIRRNDWFEVMEQICHREGVTDFDWTHQGAGRPGLV